MLSAKLKEDTKKLFRSQLTIRNVQVVAVTFNYAKYRRQIARSFGFPNQRGQSARIDHTQAS